MMSKSENSIFSDNSLSKNNSEQLSGQQQSTPNFLFGPRNRRRSLIMSFGIISFVFLEKQPFTSLSITAIYSRSHVNFILKITVCCVEFGLEDKILGNY